MDPTDVDLVISSINQVSGSDGYLAEVLHVDDFLLLPFL